MGTPLILRELRNSTRKLFSNVRREVFLGMSDIETLQHRLAQHREEVTQLRKRRAAEEAASIADTWRIVRDLIKEPNPSFHVLEACCKRTRKCIDDAQADPNATEPDVACVGAFIEGRPIVCEKEWCTGVPLIDDWLCEARLGLVACDEARIKVGIDFRLGGHKFGRVVHQERDKKQNVMALIESKVRRKFPGGEPFLVNAEGLREAVGRWAETCAIDLSDFDARDSSGQGYTTAKFLF